MRGKSILVAVVVAGLLVPSTAMAAVQGSPDLSASIVNDRLSPGQDGSIDVVLVNSGDINTGSAVNAQLNNQVTTARGLTVNLDNGSAPISINTGTRAVGTLPEGASQPISFPVSVDEDAESGTYRIPIRVSYEYTNYISEGDGAREEKSVDKTLYATVRIQKSARLSVESVSSDVRIGSSGTVSLTVENTGSTVARDTTLSLTSQNADVTVGQSESASRYLGDWQPGERRTVEYKVSASQNAEEQPYPFTLEARYDDKRGQTRTTPGHTLGVTPRDEQNFSVVATEGDVPVGSDGPYNVTLVNAGPETVTDATVTLTSQNSDVTFGQSSSASRYVGRWPAGEERTVTVTANAAASAEQRNYALSAAVDYEDRSGDPGSSGNMAVGLVPEPEQSFAIDGINSTLRVGDEGKLRGQLTNTGETAVDNVLLQWNSEQRNVNPTETEYAVGTLEPGESAQFAFSVDVSDAAESGPRQFTFGTQYRDREDDQRSGDPIDVRAEVAPASDEFDVQLEDSRVTTGRSTELNVTVTNTDDKRLTDISAKLFADSPISADDDEAFVKALEPGESRTIKFSISAGAGALEKQYPVSMDFQYEEPDGDTHTSDTYRVAVSVEQPESSGGPSLTVIGAGAVLVLLGLGAVFRYR